MIAARRNPIVAPQAASTVLVGPGVMRTRTDATMKESVTMKTDSRCEWLFLSKRRGARIDLHQSFCRRFNFADRLVGNGPGGDYATSRLCIVSGARPADASRFNASATLTRR